MIIAIDGPAASGKGTLARRIARHFGFPCLDTGLLYRAVARDVAALGRSLDDEQAAHQAAVALDTSSLDDPALRLPGAGEAASMVARHPAVRQALLELQRAFAAGKPGAVLDGRDIGTVVCPDADVKIFVTADVAVRGERRFRELSANGDQVTLADVTEVLRLRDERDAARTNAPMKPADDAILLDTTQLDIDQAFEAAVQLITRKIGRQKLS
ncbi:MAG: (d)CMP kinase [Hyphomicrobiaceae bacterium]